jgi:hypothetical protein
LTAPALPAGAVTLSAATLQVSKDGHERGLAGSTLRCSLYWADITAFSRFYWQARWGTHYSIWLFENGNTWMASAHTAPRWGHFYWTSGHV